MINAITEEHPLYDAWIEYLAKRNYSLDMYELADREYDKASPKFKEQFKKLSLMAYGAADSIYNTAISDWATIINNHYITHVDSKKVAPVFLWDYGTGQKGYHCIVFHVKDENYFKFNHRSFSKEDTTKSLPLLEKRLEGLTNYTVFLFKRIKI